MFFKKIVFKNFFQTKFEFVQKKKILSLNKVIILQFYNF